LAVQEEPEQHQRIVQVRVKVRNATSRALLQLEKIAQVKEQMREITERLGNMVVQLEQDSLEKKSSAKETSGEDGNSQKS
jgi:hypothetical protein